LHYILEDVDKHAPIKKEDFNQLIYNLVNEKTNKLAMRMKLDARLYFLGPTISEISKMVPGLKILKIDLSHHQLHRRIPPFFLRHVNSLFLNVEIVDLSYWLFDDGDVKALVPLVPNVKSLNVSQIYIFL
jgi:hypothetical protein